MATKPTVEFTTPNTQSKCRKLVTLWDYHKHSPRFPNGRPWWGFAELPAERGAPWGLVGNLTPGNHERPYEDNWEAPWLPDHKWMKPNVETGRVEILYAAMISEYTVATRKYYEKCAEIAHENKWVAPAFGGPVDSRFRAVVGRDVPQSPKIPQAALAADRWLLGFTSEINETLAKILRATTFGSGVQVMEQEPVELAPDTLSLTATDLNALIAEAVAKAMAVKAPSPAGVARAQRMRDAKQAKKLAMAEAHAA